VLIASVLLFGALVPFVRVPLGALPAFIPIYEAALVLNDLITALLLVAQFRIARSKALLVLAAVVFVPLLDLLMAVVRRTRKGMSPFSPDKMHLHHRLLEIGHSQRRAVLLIYLWAGVLAFGAVALALIDDPFIVLWAVGIGLVVAVLATAIPRVRAR